MEFRKNITSDYRSSTRSSSIFFINYAVILLICLIFARILQPLWVSNEVSTHTWLELLCIIFAAVTFLLFWNTDRENKQYNILGFGFLIVTFFNILHTIFFADFQYSLNDNFELSMKYWIVGRLIEVVVLLFFALKKSTIVVNKWIGLFFSVGFSIVFGGAIYHFSDYFPAMTSNVGLTSSKIALEFLIMILFFLTFLFIKKDINYTKELRYKYIALGALIAVPAELFFALFNDTALFYLIYGHVLKVAYYFYLYKGIFASLVTYPYKKLDEANKYINNILGSMGEGLVALDNNYNIAYINKTAEKYSNFKCESIIGKSFFDVFGDVGGIQKEYFKEVIKKRIPLHYEIVLPYNGRIFDGYIYPAAEGITLLFRDVTEQKKAEHDQTFLENLIQSTSDGIVTYDCNGIITTWNLGAEMIHGYSASEALGKHISQILHIGAGEIENMYGRLLQGETFKDVEITRFKKDGSPVYISINIFPLKNKDNMVVSIASICRDITERKIMQKEINKMDRLSLVGQLAAGIAHEVRNPLTAVRGFLQLLGTKEELSSYHTYFQLMIKELDRASEIISDFLSLTKHKLTRLENNNLNAILSNLFPIIQAEAFEQGKDIIVDYGDIPDLMVDEREIIQLILNMEKNGLEAMDPGRVLTIGTFFEGDSVVLYVKDQGSGIPKEIQSKIGQTFLTTKKNGTGLGLQVCWSIAANHNAKIDFLTGPMGTTFFVKFKVAKRVANFTAV